MSDNKIIIVSSTYDDLENHEEKLSKLNTSDSKFFNVNKNISPDNPNIKIENQDIIHNEFDDELVIDLMDKLNNWINSVEVLSNNIVPTLVSTPYVVGQSFNFSTSKFDKNSRYI